MTNQAMETGVDEDIAKLLGQPLDPALVSQRQGRGGRMVDYLEGYSAIDQANRIFGYDGWSLHVDSLTYHAAGFWYATVTVEALGVRRQDTGWVDLEGNSVEAHDTAMKGAVTDAMKRCFRTFGNQFGNSLYAKTPSTIQQPTQTPGDNSEWCPQCGKHKNAKFKVCYSCNQQAKDAPERATSDDPIFPEEAPTGPAEPWEAFVQEVEAAGMTLEAVLPKGSATIEAFTSIGGTLDLARKRLAEAKGAK